MGTALVLNTNQNYTNYYNLINFFAEFMSNHPSISQVSNEDIEDFDEREFLQSVELSDGRKIFSNLWFNRLSLRCA